jgi:hypothetical protein
MFEYFTKGQKLTTMEEDKDLRVYVTKSLKPSSQRRAVTARATAVLTQLRKNAHYRDRDTLLKGSVSRDFLGPFLACMDRSRSV